MRQRRVITGLLLVLATVSMGAQERQLYWSDFSVRAHLEADGTLRIAETQSMVFTGDWNGGERRFNIRPRQGLDFDGMARIDPQTGAETPMHQGSLSSVDRWDWTERHVLRWRARSPEAPPFDRTKIVYVLHYTLRNILQRDGEQYVLDHDFAFADREGVIERFNLELTLDPAWHTSGELQSTWTEERIQPGKSFVLRVPLRYDGTGEPLAAQLGPGPDVRVMLGALAVVPLLLLGVALLREKMIGRLEPLRTDQISRAWLQQNLLREPAEVIGAMWDESIGPSEVSAILARMVSEGKIASKVEDGEMQLTLLTSKRLLKKDYEFALIDGLFFSGDYTTTGMIRAHYADKGFNPAHEISEGLKREAQERLPKGEAVKPSGVVPTLLFLGAVAALIYTAMQHPTYVMESIFLGLGALFVSVFTLIAPNFWRSRKSLGIVAALLCMIPAAIVLIVIAVVIWRSAMLGSPDIPQEMQLALTLVGLWIFSVAAHALRSRESRESIAFLKMLGAAREFFRNELKKERPSLDDAWYPYVLAFGLSKDVDRWFRSFPGAAASFDDRWRSESGSTSSSSSSSFSPSTWTGGGGAFGGAGATGMWALAASGMAAGVSAPSSSDSGGSSSSSSSGGSSGGGGGGGW